MTGAFDGVRVLDLSVGVAGCVTGMLFADFGAEVLRPVPPGGDPDAGGAGAPMWHRGKSAAVIDPDSVAGRGVLAGLLDGADLCITGDGTGSIERAADVAGARARSPRLIHLRMPAYLGTARWAGGHDSPQLLSALSGATLRQNSSSGGPVDPVFAWIAAIHAAWAASTAAAALVERERSGLGQTVTTGGAHGGMVASTLSLLIDPDQDELPADSGPGGPNPMYTRYRASDGRWIFVAPLTPKFQVSFLAALGMQDLLDDDRVAGDLAATMSPENRGWVRARFEETFSGRTAEEWIERLSAVDVPVGRLGERDEWLDSAEVAAVGARVDLDDPLVGPVAMPADPIRLSETPADDRRPRELPGDPPEWPRVAGSDAAQEADARSVGGKGPLEGVRVLDLGVVLAGPYAGTLLAELGADVVKVEVPGGDSWRDRGWPFIRGQRCLAIDLRSDRGHTALLDLARDADVVVDNYRAGVLERLRIAHDDLVAVNPAVITASITGYGTDAAFGAAPAFDPLLQAVSGMMTSQGGPDEPVQMSVAINDVTTAALTVFGVVTALFHRCRTGKGQHVGLTLAATASFAQGQELVRWSGRPAAIVGGRDFAGPSVLDCAYPTRSGWVRVQDRVEGAADRLRDAGILAADPGSTRDGSEEITSDELGQALADLDRDDAVRRMTAAGIPVVPIRRIAELAADPEHREHGTFADVPRPGSSTLLAPGRYALFSRTQRDDVLMPCGVGEHSRELLRETGRTDADIDALVDAGVVREGPAWVPQVFAAYR